MKTKKLRRKLLLNKSTVVDLNKGSLAIIRGGDEATQIPERCTFLSECPCSVGCTEPPTGCGSGGEPTDRSCKGC